MPQLRYTGRARKDLISLWVDIAQENPSAADLIYNRLEARIVILGRFPEAGPPRPDIASEARVLVESPYLIVYRLVPDGVQVVRVLHSARHIDAALFNEGVE